MQYLCNGAVCPAECAYYEIAKSQHNLFSFPPSQGLGLGGLFPNFHLLCYSHIHENTLYYSLNFPLLFQIIPEELVQLECKNSPNKEVTQNIYQVSQQLYCIITETST